MHWIYDTFAVAEKREMDLTRKTGGVSLAIANGADNGLTAASAAGGTAAPASSSSAGGRTQIID